MALVHSSVKEAGWEENKLLQFQRVKTNLEKEIP